MSNSRHRSHGAIRVLAWDYAPSQHIASHAHVEHQLVYAATGVMTVSTPEAAWVVPPQRAVFIPGRIEHAIDIAGAVAMRTLYLSPRLGPSLPDACKVLMVSPLLRELILH